MAQPLSGDHGTEVLGTHDLFLVDGMDIALFCCQEPGTQLHAAGAQHEGRSRSPALGNTAGSNNGQMGGISDQRNQNHGSQLTHMTAAFTALGNDSRSTQAGHQLRHGNGGNHWDHLDTRLQPQLHVLAGIACAGGDHRHLFLGDDLRHFVREGT